MRVSKGGFTIVELLIVIVVIAILAAITVVAYSGIQQRANNSHTVNAVTAWVKAIKAYQADKGELPKAYDSCLGEAAKYPYDWDSTTTGSNQCRYANVSYYNVKNPFVTMMRPYIGEGPLPTPTMKLVGTSTTWQRGALYYYSIPTPGVARVAVSYVVEGSGECVSITGVASTQQPTTGGAVCYLILGEQPL